MEPPKNTGSTTTRAPSTRRPKPSPLPSGIAAHQSSFAERRAKAQEDLQNMSFVPTADTSRQDSTSLSDEGNTTKRSIMRDIDHPPPAGPRPRKMGSKPELTKKHSYFFESAFASSRDGSKESAVRDKVRSKALVAAELKTNVILESEYNMLNDLTAELGERYNRPLTAIAVTVQHGACMSFGGTFEPAYVLEIHAPAVELQPVTNKRNAALIMRHINQTLGVPPQRGHLRFVPVPEENHAVAGRTLASLMDEAVTEAVEALKGMGGSLRLNANKKNSSKQHKTSHSLKLPRLRESSSSASAAGDHGGPVPAIHPTYRGPMPQRTAKRTKSFMALLFGKTDDGKGDEDERRRLSSTS